MTQVVEKELSEIVSGSQQLRTHMDTERIEELANDIRHNGLLQPITVRLAENGYEIVCGHRRYEAHKLIGAETIECIVREMDDSEALLTAVRENEQREDFTPFDRARIYQRFLDMGISQRKLAKQLSVSQTKISQALAMDRLPECVEKAMISQLITLTHAQELLKLVRFLDEMKVNDLVEDWGYVIAFKIEQVIIHKWSAGDLRYAIDDYICGFMDDMFICSPVGVERHLVRDGWRIGEDTIRKMQDHYKGNVSEKVQEKYLMMAMKFHAKHGDFDDKYGE